MVKKLDITTLISQNGDILTTLFHHMSDMFFLMAVEQSAEEVYLFRYVLMNPAAMRVGELTEDAYGKRFEDVYPSEKATLLNQMYTEAVKSGSPIHFTTSGDVIGESILSPVIDSNGVCTHVFSVTRDITERQKLESQLAYMAYHDVLTGLPNRRLLSENLQQAFTTAKAKEEVVAALYLDCDRFKEINDTWGHDTGDLFLQMLATRLKSCVRDGDMVARLGGDEFVIVLTGLHTKSQVEKVANRVLDATQEPWITPDRIIPFSTSIGIAFYPATASEPEQLLSHADKALYKAKTAGRNQYCFYEPTDY